MVEGHLLSVVAYADDGFPNLNSNCSSGVRIISPSVYSPSLKRKYDKIMHIASSGVLKTLIPQETYWFLSYIVSPHLTNPKFHLKFRGRFRVPYDTFLKLL